MSNTFIQRATLLIQHKRYQDAEHELRQALAADPNEPYALALMGLCRMEAGAGEEALTFLKQSIGQQPDNPYFLFLIGLVYNGMEKYTEAEKFIGSAIAYDPNQAEYFGAMATIKLQQKAWEDGLTFANRGLQVDPENLTCLNTRATALLKLNRKEESFDTIKEALQNDPHNSNTHANYGWGMLERGDHNKALESFREALKLDPENSYAKAGLVEALKARYWFYRMWLKYVFWISNLSAKYQWFFIIGIYVGIRILNYLADTNPSIEPFARPIVYLYAAFALSTWVVEPLSNLFLRLNVYGRFALTRDDIRASNFTGLGLLVLLGGLLAWLFTGAGYFGLVAILGFGMMVMLGSMFKPRDAGKRKIAIAVATGLCVCGAASLSMMLLGLDGLALWQIFLFGGIAYQWILNALMVR